jgi:penicillin-binding protein 1A
MRKKNRRKKKRSSWKIKLLKIITGIVLLTAAVAILFIAAVNAGWFGALPGDEELTSITNETATLVLSSDEKLLGKYFAQNRTNISYEQLPQHLVDALVATEDVRYFQHEGFDSKSYLRVFFKTLLLGDRSAGGGSTITQQLAKNLFGRPDFGPLTLPVNKVKEAIVAYRLEKHYTKKEILLLYFNTVPFGENVYGIEAAANRYFNTATQNLSVQQAALLVGILKANTYYNPRLHPENALRRRNTVLALMNSYGYLPDKEYQKIKKAPLNLDYANLRAEGPANYFLARVRERAEDIIRQVNKQKKTSYDLENDGLRIYTTLDLRMQQEARKAVRNHLTQKQEILARELRGKKSQYIEKKQQEDRQKRELFTWQGAIVDSITRSDSLWHYKKMLHAGVLAADPRNGAIKVWVGGNHHRYLPFDLVTARRTAASAFKPLLYTAALQKDYSPCTYLSNKEKVFEEYEGWRPRNYDNSSGGFVAMWYALAHSMNIPTIDLYFKTGHTQLDYLCRRMGVERPVPESPAAALGALELSLKELVSVYAAFANFGRQHDLFMISRIEDAQGTVLYQHHKASGFQAISDSVAETMALMLHKAAREGTGRSLYSRYGLRHAWASKTGTSQNFSDARFMVFNRNLVAGVWVGAYDQKIHFGSGSNGSGAALALPIAAPILQQAEQKREWAEYDAPLRFTIDTTDILNCDGKVEQRTLKTIINAVMGDMKGDHKTDTIPEQKKEKKKEGKVKKFFKKLFGGQKE